jgi:hypothetical protein
MHFEEPTAEGTLGKLQEMGANPNVILDSFIWLDCNAMWQPDQFASELAKLPAAPDLVVLDGINRSSGRHGVDPEKLAAVDLHRNLFVDPAMTAGSAVLSLGHPVKDQSRSNERHGYGSTAWLDEPDGVGFRLEKSKKCPPGRGRLGYVSLYSVKDRYGSVEKHGTIVDGRDGWYCLGSLQIDNSDGQNLMVEMHPPLDESSSSPIAEDRREQLENEIRTILKEHGTITSERQFRKLMKDRNFKYTMSHLGPTLKELVQDGEIQKEAAAGYHL